MKFCNSYVYSFLTELPRYEKFGAVAILDYILASRREKQKVETRFKVTDLISQNPEISPWQMVDEVGNSNGSTYYALTTFLEKGLVKLSNLKRNPHKDQYAYLLTPKGIQEKSLLTHSFIEREREEFEVLKAAITTLKEEAALVSEAIFSPWRRT